MTRKFRDRLFIFMVFLFIACSSEKDRLITGKWSITHEVVGGSPSSFWFKGNGIVVAPCDIDNYAMQSEGSYAFPDDKHIRLSMHSGYYKGNVYLFEIIKLDDRELVLGGTYELLRLKRAAE